MSFDYILRSILIYFAEHQSISIILLNYKRLITYECINAMPKRARLLLGYHLNHGLAIIYKKADDSI